MNGRIGSVWRLCRGAETLGEITITEADFPWLTGRFTPRPAFAEVKPLFDAELALIEVDKDVEAWERAYSRISTTMTLLPPVGAVSAFLLHIRGDEAWFRWTGANTPSRVEPPPG